MCGFLQLNDSFSLLLVSIDIGMTTVDKPKHNIKCLTDHNS